MTFNTGNPVGSTDARDLYDNAQNLDKFSLGQELEYPDRLGVPRKSLAGIRAEVTEALSRLGYQVIGDYAAGLVVQNFGQVFRKDGEFYRAKADLALPYPLNGDWAVDAPKFVSVGDAVLRQELASAAGASMIGGAGQVVGSIASLRALLKTSPSKSAFVTGYYSQGDGGGGAYYLDASDTTSADNGGTVIVAADGGRWKLAYSDSVSVKQFGAKGDGVTSDSSATQRATEYCSGHGISVLFPSGVYLIGSHVELLTGSHWIASGVAKVYIPATCDLTGAGSYGGAARAIHNGAGISNVRISGIEFYSDGDDGIYGDVAPTIALLQVSGLTVEDCIFRNFGDATHYAQGFIAFGCTDVTIKGNRFIENSGDGAACAEGGSNIRFLANTASGNGDWGFALSNGVVGAQVIGNTFEYNVSTATGADECSEVSFIGNRSKGNEHGIRIAKFVGTFVGDQFDVIISGNASVADQFGISVESAQYFSVSGNTVRASTEQGIRISASSEGTVSGNLVIGSGLENIILSDGSSGVTVAANTAKFGTYGIRQVGSAPSPHLIAADNQISAASVAPVAGITYKADSLHLGPDGKPYFSGAPSINSDTVSLTATGGGVTLPGAPWGFIPIQVGNDIKKIPIYNP
tara:strand:- start:2230 stop:4131 length:1902 start_codon:yes stop_codon:yes gene_type:complete